MTDLATADRDELLEQYRKELTGYCYRMLGSSFEAEDAVQEALVRAWKSFDRFEGRSSVRSWLYRIATNVCFDMLNGRQRRARPVDLSPSSTIEAPLVARPENTWIEPIPDDAVMPATEDPAELAVARETIRLAFVAALQHLPARQRAVLILREVLRWQASEVAELLGTTVVSVNSALQRARATLASADLGDETSSDPDDDEQRALLERYVDAFERYDIESLVTLLRDDAAFSMPPFDLWLEGREQAMGWMLGPGAACRGSLLVPVRANGCAAFGQWKPAPGGGYGPWSLTVVETSGPEITAQTFFLDTKLFALFDLHEPPVR
jgi:RNA polymerase sigma-70 factor (ECF subfamily)